MTRNEQWIIPFGGRRTSGAIGQHLLWKHDSTYIMDNHRAAAWCWVNEGLNSSDHTIMHIDAHYDTRGVMPRLPDSFGDLSGRSYEDYDQITIADGGAVFPLFQWDNYISLYELLYRDVISSWYFCTREIGIAPDFDYTAVPTDGLLDFLAGFAPDENGVILNLDLDFFGNKDGYLFPTEFRTNVFANLRQIAESSSRVVTTVALSPDCCGSWEMAENLCSEFCKVWDIPFELPAEDPTPE